jgi:hypothetical protein
VSKKGDKKKGDRIEKDFMSRLENMGFVCDRAERSIRIIPVFSQAPCVTCHRRPTWTITKKHDTFGCFDIIAKHRKFKDYTYYFQIAANRWKYGDDRKNMEDFPAGNYDYVYMVRKMDRKPYELKKLITINGIRDWHPAYMIEIDLGRLNRVEELEEELPV